MLTNPLTVQESDSLHLAMKTITKNKVSGVCVVNDNRDLVGVLSEMDCLKAILNSVYNKSLLGFVSDYMTKEFSYCNAHDDVVVVASNMIERRHRRLPVVDNGKLVGQITCRQILRVVSQFNDPN